MAYIGKVFNFERQENYEDYLNALGIPAEKQTALQQYKPAIKMDKNGDSYTMSMITPNGTRTLTFTSGVEFDDVSVTGAKTKTKVTVDGDTFTEVKTSDGSSATFKREFSADKLVITMTLTGWDSVSTRYYSA